MRPIDEGTITLEGNRLAFSAEHYGDWTVSVDNIAVIGEYTTSEGPWLPDYFWVVVQKQGTWHIASNGAKNLATVLGALKRRLGGDWKYGLCGSVDIASHIVWPTVLAGKPLFTFSTLPITGWRRLLFFLGPDFKIDLTVEVKEYLKSLLPVSEPVQNVDPPPIRSGDRADGKDGEQ